MKNQKSYIKYACAVATVVALTLAGYGGEIRSGERGMLLIGNAEGCYQKPYQCPADVLTVGIGTTAAVAPVVRHKIYSLEEIAALYATGLKQAEKCVNRYANGKNMPQGAFEALTSITFNIGCTKLKNSTLFHMARKGYTPAMCNQFTRWIYADGKVLPGLVTRRQKERELCLTP